MPDFEAIRYDEGTNKYVPNEITDEERLCLKTCPYFLSALAMAVAVPGDFQECRGKRCNVFVRDHDGVIQVRGTCPKV